MSRLCCLAILLMSLNTMAQLNFSSGRISKKHYCDTIRYDKKLGYIVIPVTVNGVPERLIFDTGADLLLLAKDSVPKKSAVAAKVTDSQGAEATMEFDNIKAVGISQLSFTDFIAIRTNLPKTLSCMADGLIGNNIIKKSNWQITDSYLVISDRSFKVKDQRSIRVYYRGANSTYANMIINGAAFDTCLIDYGGRFEMEVPQRCYDDFKKHLKKTNSVRSRIKGGWGVNGKTIPDTTTIINCDLDFNGIAIPDVNVTFSKRLRERRIGVLLLNRFSSVYINSSDRNMCFGLPLKASEVTQSVMPISIDLEQNQFVVDGKWLNESTTILHAGDRYISVNGQRADAFGDYCAFMDWRQELENTATLTLVTPEGKTVEIRR